MVDFAVIGIVKGLKQENSQGVVLSAMFNINFDPGGNFPDDFLCLSFYPPLFQSSVERNGS